MGRLSFPDFRSLTAGPPSRARTPKRTSGRRIGFVSQKTGRRFSPLLLWRLPSRSPRLAISDPCLTKILSLCVWEGSLSLIWCFYQSPTFKSERLCQRSRTRRFTSAGRLPQSQPRAAPVFLDELDASTFKSAPNDVQGSAPGLTYFVLQLIDGDGADSCLIGKCLLGPAKETSGSSGLGGCDAHWRWIASQRKIYKPSLT